MIKERVNDMAKKRLFSSYLSEELYELVYFLMEREEINKVTFVKRAIRYYMAGDRKLDSRVLITKRNDPDYIERKALFSVHLEEDQKMQLKEVALEKKCKPSQVFFQVILEYCAVLISIDDSGLEIEQ
ncbi:MAG: hypothetical protein J6K58_06705 [Lachnospiraceae bacterium]|nr:hypothetical protein [Lachnospiraceae bacterium]MBP3458881.1 hypothetical protein [Lachnospiraceae bacterium]